MVEGETRTQPTDSMNEPSPANYGGIIKRLLILVACGALGAVLAFLWSKVPWTTKSDKVVSEQRIQLSEDCRSITSLLDEIDSGPAQGISRTSGIRASVTELEAFADNRAHEFQYSPAIRKEVEIMLDESIALRDLSRTSTPSPSTDNNSITAALRMAAANRKEQQKEELNTRLQEATETTPSVPESIKQLERQAEALEQRKANQLATEKLAILESEFKADQRQIEHMLVPFTTPGRQYTVPEASNTHRSIEPRPISLQFLRKRNCLESTNRSLENFMNAAIRNGRPTGPFPTRFGGLGQVEYALDEMRTAQGLLIKYGELMVRKGLLSP